MPVPTEEQLEAEVGIDLALDFELDLSEPADTATVLNPTGSDADSGSATLTRTRTLVPSGSDSDLGSATLTRTRTVAPVGQDSDIAQVVTTRTRGLAPVGQDSDLSSATITKTIPLDPTGQDSDNASFPIFDSDVIRRSERDLIRDLAVSRALDRELLQTRDAKRSLTIQRLLEVDKDDL